MDCIDCHNRLTHIYKTPNLFVNEAILSSGIEKSLPKIKSICVELLSKDYENEDVAVKMIEENLKKFYKENYPELFETR